jgi:hypothetical protein
VQCDSGNGACFHHIVSANIWLVGEVQAVGGRTVKWDGLSGERAADASYGDDLWQGGLQLGERKYVAGCVRGRLDMLLLTPCSVHPSAHCHSAIRSAILSSLPLRRPHPSHVAAILLMCCPETVVQ